MSLSDELVARIASLEAQVKELQSRERPLVDRGWRDDFIGVTAFLQYTPVVFGAGSAITLVDNAHGGWVRITAGPAAGRYAQLWLGDNADNYDTLDADEGWTQIARMRLSSVADLTLRCGANDSTLASDVIHIGYDSAQGAEWLIATRDAGGAWNHDLSDVAADTDWHVHRMEVYPDAAAGGYRVDYFLDGDLINYTTAEVPTAVITPIVYCLARAAVSKYADLDYWVVVPRNLS